MDVLNGRIAGPLIVRHTVELGGQIDSGVTVNSGATFFIRGLVGGCLRVRKGAKAVVRGIVAGDVDVEEGGNVEIYGCVTGHIRDLNGRCCKSSDTA